MTNSVSSLVAQRAREVGHPVEVGDAAPVDPAVELAGVKPLDAACLERGFELGEFELGQVGVDG